VIVKPRQTEIIIDRKSDCYIDKFRRKFEKDTSVFKDFFAE